MKDYELFNSSDISFRRRSVHIYGDVCEPMIQKAIKNLQYLDSTAQSPVKIYLNTYGGDIYEAFALYDVIRAMRSEVYIFGMGKVMSAGAIILCAGDNRYMYKRATLMVHSVSDEIVGTIHDIKISVAEGQRMQKMMVDVFRDRTNKRHHKFWESFLQKDRYLTAAEAIDLGFIDEIIEDDDEEVE